MLEMHADNYIRIGEIVCEMRSVLAEAQIIGRDDPDSPLAKLDAEEIRKLGVLMDALRKVCDDSNLVMPKVLLEKRKKNLPKTEEELNILADAVKAELRTRLYLHIPNKRARFYNMEDILSAQGRTAFPLAFGELREAGNCFAAGLATACVFHCMRALEYGLGALARDVGLEFDIQNWQNIIDQIEAKIKISGKTLPRGTSKNERMRFLSEAAKEFYYFKDGWRNHVSHNRVTYDEAGALRVMNHVRDFFETLSACLAE